MREGLLSPVQVHLDPPLRLLRLQRALFPRAACILTAAVGLLLGLTCPYLSIQIG